MVPTERITLGGMRGRIFVPPGIDPQEFSAMLRNDPELAKKLLAEREGQINTLRSSYQRMLGPQMTDKDFENALNDPELQGKLEGRRMKDQSEKQEKYQMGMRMGRGGL